MIKKLKVIQNSSPIRRTQDQRSTLIGLGLNKIGREAVLNDTKETRGMIRKVSHMVIVQELNSKNEDFTVLYSYEMNI